ncbi:hypothetical protein BDF21DRAFT_447747 [Thamnidium elegans]|nr:hypothetical protein BDF21DRAFT_447747 [Thamnidium elegans]
MFKKNSFTVYLINEFKTSSYYPTYKTKLETFKTATNPRPHHRHKMPTVVCHRLLRRKNVSCLQLKIQEVRRRLWNREQAAALNFRKILNSLRDTEIVEFDDQDKKLAFLPKSIVIKSEELKFRSDNYRRENYLDRRKRFTEGGKRVQQLERTLKNSSRHDASSVSDLDRRFNINLENKHTLRFSIILKK